MTAIRHLLPIVVLYVLTTTVWAENESAQERIDAHNFAAEQLYAGLKSKYIKNTDPLIIAWGDHLSFYHNQTVQNYPILPTTYNNLKATSHVMLAVFALFNPLNHFPANIDAVRYYQNTVKQAKTAIDNLPFSDQQKHRQKQILSITNAFLDNALQNQKVGPDEMKQFVRVIKPLILEDIADATQLELNSLNEQMTKIQTQLKPEELKQLFVVIPTPKMPRQDNIVAQFFVKYFNAPMDSKRLIFAEGLSNPDAILQLVGSWQEEAQLSMWFFHDPDRMKHDLVSTDARRLLEKCQPDVSGHKALRC